MIQKIDLFNLNLMFSFKSEINYSSNEHLQNSMI